MELYLPKKIPEDRWFNLQQNLLLKIANCRGGRDLLCIPQDYPKIIKIMPNEVRSILGRDKKLIYLQSDFRTAPKWARVIRHRWQEFQEMARWFYEEDRALGFRQFFPVLVIGGQRFDTGTYYPDAGTGGTTVDGKVRRTGVSEAWATIIAGAGNAVTAVGTVGAVTIVCTATSNQWATLERDIFLFNSAGLTASAVISATVMSLFGTDKNDTNSITPNLDIYTSSPASDNNLVIADFSQIAAISQTGSPITYASWSIVGYNAFTFDATGRGNVSKTGISKFGCRNANYDVSGTPPAWANGTYADLDFSMADEIGTSQDPKLVVTYTLPSTGQFLSGLRNIW